MSVGTIQDQGVRILSINSDDEVSVSESVEPENISGCFEAKCNANMAIEKKIYLRAALRLLDLRDQSVEDKHRWIRGRHEGSTSDLIKYGTLRKSSSAVGRGWKEKYVELRHGVLSYEDLSGWGETSNRKTIKLLFKRVKCYPIKTGHFSGRFVFALSEADGPKRMWMAESEEEFQIWVDSIKTAMIGSAGDFSEIDAQEMPPLADIDADMGSSSHFNLTTENGASSSSLLRHTSQLESEHSKKKMFSSSSDSGAYFGSDVQRFTSVQFAFANAPSSDAYRDLLSVYSSEPKFTVPVSCISIEGAASQVSSLQKRGSHRSLHSISNQKKLISTEQSQAWKDLHRDVITVNGVEISGATGGPEEMIGTLVRVILKHVQSMRERFVTSSGAPLSALSSTEEIGKMRKRQATYSDLDESQALSCARDVLLSCNRTQSGGDTYYTVESLLVNKEFAVLTPFACEADPLEIIVDIVESERRRALANIEENDGSDASASRAHEASTSPELCKAALRDDSFDEEDTDFHHGRLEPQARSSEHSRNTDDTTESSGNTPSITTSEEDEAKDSRGAYYTQVYSPGALGYDSTEMPSDIAGATALPSSVLMSREYSRRGKSRGSGTVSGGSSVASGSSASSTGTEAEVTTHSTPEDMNIALHQSGRPISMGMVELPSAKISAQNSSRDLHCSSDQTDADYGGAVGSGKHRRSRTNPDPLEPLSIPCAVSAGHGEDEDTVAMSELTLDTHLQQKSKRKDSTFKKAMQFVSPAHRSMKSKQDKEKAKFSFNKFSANQSSPMSNPVGVDELSAGSEDQRTPSGKKKKNLLRRAFGGKDDKSSVSTSSSPSTEKRRKDRRHKHHDVNSDTDDEESAAQSMCIRIQVIAKSKYRLCNLDPQNDHDDNYAIVNGEFHQVFFLKSNSNGRPSVSDRLITIDIEK